MNFHIPERERDMGKQKKTKKMLQPIFLQQLPSVIEKFKQHKIKRAYAFDSVCTNKFNESSDFDLLISFVDGLEPLERGELYWSLLFELEDS